MIKHKDHFHGSDLEKIEEIYGIKKEEIVSFSANVNPLGVSPLLRTTLADKIDAITTYPDREYTSLRKCIAAYCGTDHENVIVGNGSTELISLFIQIEHPKKAMIIGPTYSEYEREISLGGGTTLYYPLREKDDFKLDVNDFISHLNENIDLLVICNPNNPTSSCITSADMRHILDACKEYDIYVMVDETYVEFAENMEEIDSVPLTNYYNNIVILRGTSKFFAAPGLRLGYAITGNRDLIKAINTFDVDKNIKLATYASRCIENEILMYLRRNNKTKLEVSIDEPLNVDWDGNELLLSDILGTDEDIIYRDLEDETERKLLNAAIDRLNPREQKIVKLRFGLGREQEDEMTQKEVADLLGISQSYISRLEKKIMKRLKKEISQQCGLSPSR